jgi:hypothetical protein
MRTAGSVPGSLSRAWPILLAVATLFASTGLAQNPSDAEPLPLEPPPANAVVIHYIQKEMFIPGPLAFPNGLDAVEVHADQPGRHSLVVLTHGTSDTEEERRT